MCVCVCLGVKSGGGNMVLVGVGWGGCKPGRCDQGQGFPAFLFSTCPELNPCIRTHTINARTQIYTHTHTIKAGTYIHKHRHIHTTSAHTCTHANYTITNIEASGAAATSVAVSQVGLAAGVISWGVLHGDLSSMRPLLLHCLPHFLRLQELAGMSCACVCRLGYDF